MRGEDGCTRLNGNFSQKLEGNTEGLQGAQVLVPRHRRSLNPNICRLCRCLTVGCSNKKFPLEETIFLGTRDIVGSKD